MSTSKKKNGNATPTTSSGSTSGSEMPLMEQHLTSASNGLSTALPSTVTGIPIDGQVLSPTVVQQQIAACLTKYAAVDSAKASYTVALTARTAIEPQAETLLKGVWAFVKVLFPNDAAAQAKFGLVLKQRAQATALQKAAQAEKAKATRAKNKPAAAPPSLQLIDADGNVIGAQPASTASPAPAPTASAPAPATK